MGKRPVYIKVAFDIPMPLYSKLYVDICGMNATLARAKLIEIVEKGIEEEYGRTHKKVNRTIE